MQFVKARLIFQLRSQGRIEDSQLACYGSNEVYELAGAAKVGGRLWITLFFSGLC